MKHFLITTLLLSFIVSAVAQSEKVAQAETAFNSGDFTGAYDLANAAIQALKGMDQATGAKAFYIRAKSGIKVSYDFLLKGDDNIDAKHLEMPLKSYRDYQQALHMDAGLKEQIHKEYTRLGNALLVAGTRYDSKFKENTTAPDSAVLDKGIANFTGAIEVFAAIGSEKFKPYLFRGDAYFAKKKFSQASDDYNKAMDLFETSPHNMPDFNIGDLGYRLAYMQAAVFGQKELALKTIERARKLLQAEMELANTKKEKLGERYAECKTEYDYFIAELDKLNISVKQ